MGRWKPGASDSAWPAKKGSKPPLPGDMPRDFLGKRERPAKKMEFVPTPPALISGYKPFPVKYIVGGSTSGATSFAAAWSAEVWDTIDRSMFDNALRRNRSKEFEDQNGWRNLE